MTPRRVGGARLAALARGSVILVLAHFLALAGTAEAQFQYLPVGELAAGSGIGRVDERVYAPEMVFPIRDAPAYANSQVYGIGGSQGGPGTTCDSRNFRYPWSDNYCERRTWDMPLCSAGTGHQGQDIRASSCEKNIHPAIAVVDGTITNVGSYSVYLTAADGTRFDYLHMGNVAVSVGQRVTTGTIVGYVSNEFGGTPTSIHLHFNIRQSITGLGSVYVPPYTSLIRAYQALIGVEPRLRATFVSQTFPLASEGLTLAPGEEFAGEIVMRNSGSQTWPPNAIRLATSEPRDGDSVLVGPDWLSPTRAAGVAVAIAPGETATFAFTIRAPQSPGEYRQYFNLVEEGTAWFGDQGGPPDNQLQIRVLVTGRVDRDGGESASPLDASMVLAASDDAGMPDDSLDSAMVGHHADDFDAETGRTTQDAEVRQLNQGCGCRVQSQPSRPSVALFAIALFALTSLSAINRQDRRHRGGKA